MLSAAVLPSSRPRAGGDPDVTSSGRECRVATESTHGGLMKMGYRLQATGYSRNALVRVLAAMLAMLAFSVAHAQTKPTTKPESVGMSSERLKRIHEAMQRHIDAGVITGAVTAVARRGQVVHFEAHGYFDVEKKTPMTKD